MDTERTATLRALRDFFMARGGEDLAAAHSALSKGNGGGATGRETAAIDWEAAEFAFNKLFVGPMALQAPPYASCYLEPEPQLMGQSTLQVRRLYEMAGMTSPLEGRLPCDHLGVELDAALGILAMAGRSGADEPRALWEYFLNEHLKRWLPLFLDRARKADAGHPAVDLALETLEAWLDEAGNGREGYDQ
jgi:TorA maturation chaperone TorD